MVNFAIVFLVRYRVLHLTGIFVSLPVVSTQWLTQKSKCVLSNLVLYPFSRVPPPHVLSLAFHRASLCMRYKDTLLTHLFNSVLVNLIQKTKLQKHQNPTTLDFYRTHCGISQQTRIIWHQLCLTYCPTKRCIGKINICFVSQ